MKATATERLQRFYSVFKTDDHVLVVINADPDAIGAALCVKRLLWRKVASVNICSISTVKRPDNVAMVELLGVNLEKASEICKTKFTRFVLVDSQPTHNECYNRFRFDAIIDHHPVVTHQHAIYEDIRPEYGATCSIMTEYLRAAKIRPTKKLATALILGIKTDTKDFQRLAFSRDIRAFQFLSRSFNLNLIQQIESSEIHPAYLKFFQMALETKVMKRGRIYVHLRSEERRVGKECRRLCRSRWSPYH
jgi:nanoRNase/pAp phosphatase (c-di-AMP/oligoRNAs hydrolase)